VYVPMRDESKPIFIKIPWDKNTARGFAIALMVIALLMLLLPVFRIKTPYVAKYEVNKVPIEYLNFGSGDGTGISKGNLTEEGEKFKGKSPASELEDAAIAAKKNIPKVKSSDDINNATSFVPVKQLPSDEKHTAVNEGTGVKNIGSPEGSDLGTGLGDKGFGVGSGLGLGDIEWGGGGNRIVLHKKLPKYPPGVNTGARIRILFTVSRDGTVMNMVPLQKGDPVLEKAAMDALREWRFNPLNVDKEMTGIITFTFKLS
jgi:TonB family protein